jgi:NTP pyrophosphatase (non-canonical NTP hydrolase)
MDYIEAAGRTKSELCGPVEPDTLHAIVGIASEAGEMLDALKKHIFYNQQMDSINLAEELGDLMWYMALLCRRYGWTFEEIQKRNIAKLKARYPEKFTEEKSLNRDLDAERKALETESEFMTPAQVIESLKKLNASLMERLEEQRQIGMEKDLLT